MTQLQISPKALEMWIHQNKAEYTGDYVDGCLLDNFVLFCKHGVAAFYEHYVNCWTSDYMVEFERGKAEEVWKHWYAFEESTQNHRKGK